MIYGVATVTAIYITLIIKMFRPTRNGWDNITTRLVNWAENPEFINCGGHALAYILQYFVARILFIAYVFFSSCSIDLMLNWVWFSITLWGLIGDRKFGESLMQAGQTENVWGFGQILPNLLLLSLVVACIEFYYGSAPTHWPN